LEYALAVVFALLLWWFSTGAVLYVVGLPKRTFGRSMTAVTILALLALVGVVVSSNDATTLGAYCAFTCALLVWAWHEMSFLTGVVTGPRNTPCPPDSKGWARFAYAAQTLLYHEAAILLTALLIVALTWGAPNQIGVWTFLVLWAMRLSAKFNVFLGVPNLTEEFLPDNLSFLKSYFRKRPMNLLFPVSVTASTVVTWALFQEASDAEATGFVIAGFTMLTTLMALAVLEHWFLVLPLPAAALWSWGLKSREAAAPRSTWKNDRGGLASAGPAWAKTVVKEEAPLVTLPGR
jgi:putative photosynthetic complex assembly protein 2